MHSVQNNEFRAIFANRAGKNSVSRRTMADALPATQAPRRGLKDYLFYGAVAFCGFITLGSIGLILESPENREARLKEQQARGVETARLASVQAKTDAIQAKADAKAQREGACAGKEVQAYVMTQDAVRSRLKSPSSAEFPWITDVVSAHSGGCKYEVLAYVDAQNGFGAMLRTTYGARLTFDAESERWRIDSVKLAE